MPSIVTSLGIALEFRVLDDFLKSYGPDWIADDLQTTMGLFTSGLGAHLTWTLPFGLLVMFAIFNRFDGRYEEAARDLGRDALADPALCHPADHPALGDRRRPVRLHAVLGRDRALQPDRWASTTRCRWNCRR